MKCHGLGFNKYWYLLGKTFWLALEMASFDNMWLQIHLFEKRKQALKPFGMQRQAYKICTSSVDKRERWYLLKLAVCFYKLLNLGVSSHNM